MSELELRNDNYRFHPKSRLPCINNVQWHCVATCLRGLVALRCIVLSSFHAPFAEISNRGGVKGNSLSAEFVQLGSSQNNLGGVDSGGKDTKLRLFSSHVEAGNSGSNLGSRWLGGGGPGPLGDHKGGSQLGVCHGEGVGRRQDEGEEKNDGLVGFHCTVVIVAEIISSLVV